MVCSSCGEWIDDVMQPYCERCGAELGSGGDSSSAAPDGTPV
ncbi:MAG TPA: hypothetical protein VFA70_07600 [Dehalococcoidia bacterium]|nr:hypothetical protein [Dehalococcoidia bacterium]